MDREEVLARSRQANEDEGVEFIANKGRRYGVAGMAIMFLVLGAFNLWQGQDCYQISAMFWCYLGLEAYGMYKGNDDKVRLSAAVMGILVGILSAIMYAITVLR